VEPARLQVPDGTLEALKWLALVLMVLDHVNKWLYGGALTGASQVARLAFPIFAFVLAHNLARPGVLESGGHRRVMRRLAVFGLLATPPFIALVGHFWPLNILFSLLAGSAIVLGLQRGDGPGTALVVVVFALGGLAVEYGHAGLALFVAAWAFSRRPDAWRVTAWALATAALWWVNDSGWAIGAVPLLLLASQLDLRLPRLRWAFYALYPGHLALIWLVQRAGA